MAGASQPRTHRPTGGALVGPEVVRTLYTAAKNLKIDVRTNTHAEQILTDKSGRVVGLKVKGKDGTYTIHSKAVVDAAGGFGANNEMVAKYVPRLKGFATTNHPGATGDGLLLAVLRQRYAEVPEGHEQLHQAEVLPQRRYAR